VTKRLAAALLVVALLGAGGRLGAWGPQGHHIVALLAESRLTPAAYQAVDALLGRDGFVAAATWADDIRKARPETYNWHFVDIPIDKATYQAERDCPATEKGDCVIAELTRARNVLRNASAPSDQRGEALKFVIHFVSDLHQPLHAIDNADRGGNDTRVLMADGRSSNLHAIWDSFLIQSRGLDEPAYVAMLTRDMEQHPLDPGPIDFVKWAEAAHQVALDAIYAFPEFTPGTPPKEPVRLSDAYFRRAAPAVDRQLELAAVRLAAVVNDALNR
jgi:nuclease S1